MRAGLGNQMFQYAVGRHLAIINDDQLKLDLSWFRNQGNRSAATRNFNLNKFNIRAEEATKSDLERVFKLGPLPTPKNIVHCLNRGSEVINPIPTEIIPQICGKLLNYYWEIRDNPPLIEPSWPYHHHYCPKILELEGDVYLAGFWVAPSYFTDIAETIREEFTVTKEPAGKDRTLQKEIGQVQSVGVHVRRGDFVKLNKALPKEYYMNAAGRIADDVDNPNYYVFSNDPGWVEDNLKLGSNQTVVKHNDGTTDYEDFRLLRRCKHQIISNSSFSWWAAWLNENENKCVIQPQVATERNPYAFCSDWIPIEG